MHAKMQDCKSSQRLVMEDMGGDGGGEEDEEEAESPVVGDEDGAVQEGEPYEADGQDLDFQRDGFMLTEVLDIRAKFGMLKKPVVETGRAAEEERCREKQQRCGREDGQEDAEYAQSEGQQPQSGEKQLHHFFAGFLDFFDLRLDSCIALRTFSLRAALLMPTVTLSNEPSSPFTNEVPRPLS